MFVQAGVAAVGSVEITESPDVSTPTHSEVEGHEMPDNGPSCVNGARRTDVGVPQENPAALAAPGARTSSAKTATSEPRQLRRTMLAPVLRGGQACDLSDPGPIQPSILEMAAHLTPRRAVGLNVVRPRGCVYSPIGPFQRGRSDWA